MGGGDVHAMSSGIRRHLGACVRRGVRPLKATKSLKFRVASHTADSWSRGWQTVPAAKTSAYCLLVGRGGGSVCVCVCVCLCVCVVCVRFFVCVTTTPHFQITKTRAKHTDATYTPTHCCNGAGVGANGFLCPFLPQGSQSFLLTKLFPQK